MDKERAQNIFRHKLKLTATVIFGQEWHGPQSKDLCIALNYILHYNLYLYHHHEWINHALIAPSSSLFTWLQWNPKHIHSTICNYLITYQLRFGVLFWYTLEVQQKWTTVCAQDDCTIGSSPNGPCSQPLAICPYAASVKWIPSQLQCVLGPAHAEAPGSPHFAVRLKLWGPLPGAPQHALGSCL